MMFTEGLDESAISWIKQGTDSPAPPRSPLAERPPLGQVAAAPRSPALHGRACGAGAAAGFFSPKGLPPVRTTGTRHSGLLGRHSALLSAADSDEWEDVEDESVASWGMPEDCYGGHFSETADEACSSDSSQLRRAMDRCAGVWDDEVTSQLSRKGGGIVRGQSKEFLRVEVRAAGAFAAGKCSGAQDPVDSSSRGHCFEEKFQTPSAPPIAGDGEEVMFDAVGVQMPYVENNLLAQIPSFTIKNCMEAPEFLRDECMVLRSAFGIQNFLLHPKYSSQVDGKQVCDKDGSCTIKGRKLVKQIDIEVKKIRVVPHKPKLRATSSFRNLYMQAGSDYVRQISKIVKSQVTMLTSTSSTSLPEEMFTCTLELQSSCKGHQRDSISPQYLKPGTGESQLFYLESQGDVILVEVQDNNRVIIGRAKIQVSSLTDTQQDEIIRWWPLYLEDQECVGKIQLCMNLSMSSNNNGSEKMLQGGPAVDTIIYDMVLEAAMRAQSFSSKTLHISGSWKWLLDEFSDYYGVSDAYRKLRYLSYIMNVAIPTKDCLELIYELLLPVMKAREDRTLTRQEVGFFKLLSPPSRPLQHVAELIIATADFERDLDSWQVRPVHGGVVSRELFHDYIMVWIEDTRLHLLDNCKAEKTSCPAVSTISPFVEQMYEQIKESIHEYGVVINRWPQYLMSLESAVADVEREIMKALEKQYMETLMPLRDGIPKYLEKQVQRLTRRQSIAPYVVPSQLGAFMNTVKRMLDVLHCRVEDILKSWAAYLTITSGNTVFGEQMNSITVMLRKKYKNYLKAIVDKLVSNAQANRNTRLKRILEETREADGESDIRERMQAVRLQLSDSIHNLHEVFSSRIFVAICRGFWDRVIFGQIVLRFLESRKENRIWYRGSDYALGILDDVFASEMQKLLGNALQDKDLDPPQSVIDARSILC
ncbi:hypothetical protein BAE44_0005757 [Dichanthelium oligosanthes]|uniref:Uncharacterized protein n=1 Tax=Dichanthelium oligosanthes TaxID=888268 RepID=A0A1E5W789_9POAL|nr:hypothetical protein BAE44_0005757 [Dichanthelium oligosanthes]